MIKQLKRLQPRSVLRGRVQPTVAVTKTAAAEKPKPKIQEKQKSAPAHTPKAPQYDAALYEKLHRVRKTLNDIVFEREEETDGILLSVLAGVNTLFIGDVGTAKTFHIQTAATLLGLSHFDILMSETVKPDQIFGPADIPALAQGRQQTKYKGYAPDSEILFFDEIFKANATVLNPLLWLINEHRFRDGDNGVIKCKVKATFGASNELPTDTALKALYDRFLLRYNVKYLKDDDNIKKLIDKFLSAPAEVDHHVLSREEVESLRALVKTVELVPEVRDVAMTVRRQVERALSVEISDRRFFNAFKVMQAHALLHGRLKVNSNDLEVLAHMFWSELSHIPRVHSIVYSQTSDDSVELSTYSEQAALIRVQVAKGGKLKTLLGQAQSLYEKVKGRRGRYSRSIQSEIHSLCSYIQGLIDSRKTINAILVTVGKTKVLKISLSSSTCWTRSELYGLGFKFKRKGDYWYYPGAVSRLRAALDQRGIVLKVVDLS